MDRRFVGVVGFGSFWVRDEVLAGRVRDREKKNPPKSVTWGIFCFKAPGFEGPTLAGCRSSRATSMSPALALRDSILEHSLLCQGVVGMMCAQCRLPSPGIPCERRCAGTPFNSPSERGRKRIVLCEGDGHTPLASLAPLSQGERGVSAAPPIPVTLGPPLNLPLRGGGKKVRVRGHDRRSRHHPPLWIPAFAGMTGARE